MITLGIYGYKKFQKHRDKKKLNQNIGEAPPVVDQSAEFVLSPTSPAEGGAVSYAESNRSRFGGTASEPTSAVDTISAGSRHSQEYAPSSTLSSNSSEYQAYQQYVERQSNSFRKENPDQPPTYQAALSPPPGQPAGTWIFVPAGGHLAFANASPTHPLPLSPQSTTTHPASPSLANELPASLPPATYEMPTTNELPAAVPVTTEGNTDMKSSEFQRAADDALSRSGQWRQSDSDQESRKGGEIKRYELA